MGLLVLCGSYAKTSKWILPYPAHDLPVNFICSEYTECSVFLLKSALVLTVLQEKTISGYRVFPALTRRDEMKSSFRKYFFRFPGEIGPHKTHSRLIPLNVLTSSTTNEA